MLERDEIKDLFADKLANAQSPVNPELWSAISAKIGTSTIVSTGLSTAAKWMIGLGTAASVTVATVLFVNYKEDKETVQTQKDQKIQLTQTPVSNLSKPVAENKQRTELKDPPKADVLFPFMVPVITDEIVEELVFDENRIGSGEENVGSVVADKEVTDVRDTKVVAVAGDQEVLKKDLVADKQVTNKTNLAEDLYIGKLSNIFTINNDGINDYFTIQLKGVEDFTFTVLNQKNEVVYKSDDTNFKWDGRDLRGDLIPGGEYIYFFTGKDSVGNPVTKYCSLTVVVK